MKMEVSFGSVMALLILLWSLVFPPLSTAVEFVEEFDSPALNKKVWDIKTAGKASFKIEKGVLTMESPGVDSGIILYHPRNIQDVDITFEVKVEVSGLKDNISLGFMQALLDPQINTEINNNLASTFYFVADKWYIKQDPVVIGQKPPNPGIEGQYKKNDWNVVQLDYSNNKGKITFYINGKNAGQVEQNKQMKERYFYITSDPYTSHYTGGVTIDYIKISGPGAAELAVEPRGKLTLTWGRIKSAP